MKLVSIYTSLCIFPHNIFVEKEKYHELQIHYFNSSCHYYYFVFLINIKKTWRILYNICKKWSCGQILYTQSICIWISLIELVVRLDVIMIREDFQTGLDQATYTEVNQGMVMNGATCWQQNLLLYCFFHFIIIFK